MEENADNEAGKENNIPIEKVWNKRRKERRRKLAKKKGRKRNTKIKSGDSSKRP